MLKSLLDWLTVANLSFALIALFGTVALRALLWRLRDGSQDVSLEAKWGTLGGGNKGYRLSPAAALLLLVLSCVVALVILGYENAPHLASTSFLGNQQHEVELTVMGSETGGAGRK